MAAAYTRGVHYCGKGCALTGGLALLPASLALPGVTLMFRIFSTAQKPPPSVTRGRNPNSPGNAAVDFAEPRLCQPRGNARIRGRYGGQQLNPFPSYNCRLWLQ